MNKLVALFLVSLFAVPAFAQRPWTQLRNGDDVLNCFGARVSQLARPFFRTWTENPTFDVEAREFRASWRDIQGGFGVAVLTANHPPESQIHCEMAKTTDFLGRNQFGLACVPNLSSAVAHISYQRRLILGTSAPVMNEQVPLIVIRDNKMWCTN